ncbi:3-demethylubiquinone-9 3-methyltransferase-like protein [Plasmodium coatneyi]|uniref:3-demethylubiquinone-9 3-methyltransferase-like protein n=1 Tax=Plasmodium coatneyi TaxID=208452 RepID=A0A1B1DTZ1_9APIC|nr:3-demethylubiquinone-9 3-methyltransferase-like protein [Plasmodium coatneyi]ANQ06266.1 3-demethylubiquinone-9 3-methyltransferase-like protein [Plasmodium coatneyi]
MQHLLGGLKPSGGKAAHVGKAFLHRQQRNKTFDERERSFFDQMHSEWWNDKRKDKRTWCDVLCKVAGANTYSLHDYNKHRFNFICKNYEFLFFEKMKEGGKGENEKKEDITINVLDVGCGGGILCEYMRKNFSYFFLKSDITGRGSGCSYVPGRKVHINIDGIDVSSKLIDVARRRQQAEGADYTGMSHSPEEVPPHIGNRTGHMNHRSSDQESNWKNSQTENTPWNSSDVHIKQRYYNCDITDLTEWSKKEGKKYNVIVSSEVIEHVPNGKKEEYVRCISQLCSPEALVVFTTIDKNLLSYFYSIVLAEYVTGMVKKGTHHYDQFIGSDELSELCALFDLQNVSTEHAVYIPFVRDYFRTRWLKLLYLSAFVYRGGATEC